MNELIPITDGNLCLNGGTDRYISMNPDTPQAAASLYNALNNNTGSVSDLINKTVTLYDVLMEPTEFPDHTSGEIIKAVRTVLIVDDGASFGTISNGIVRSLRNLSAVFGTLHFEDGIKIKIEQIETKKGRTYNIRLV